MSLGQTDAFTIASGGTASDGIHHPGYRLVGLVLPTLDSTTIGFSFSPDGGSTWTIVNINDHGSVVAVLTLGNANTGGIAQAVPEEVGKLSIAGELRLNTVAQTGGARTIIGIWEKVA